MPTSGLVIFKTYINKYFDKCHKSQTERNLLKKKISATGLVGTLIFIGIILPSIYMELFCYNNKGS